LRGFTNGVGNTYYFNDTYDLPTAFYSTQQGRAFGPAGWMTPLGWGSNYNDLTNHAGVGRENLNLTYGSFYNAVYTLSYYGRPGGANTQVCSRALLLMIQYFSEAARFNDVYGFITARVPYQGQTPERIANLPLFQQYLENSWAQISYFGWQISQNPNTSPLTVTGINPDNYGDPYTLYSFGDVQRFLAVMLNPGEVFDPNMGGYSGDWYHDEL
jgi:hypothetical protein